MTDTAALFIHLEGYNGVEIKLCFLPEGKWEPKGGSFVQGEELSCQQGLLSPNGLVLEERWSDPHFCKFPSSVLITTSQVLERECHPHVGC